ncbi:MAG: thiamine-phosphate synthase family protein [Candidatus Caldarchaeum sp.]
MPLLYKHPARLIDVFPPCEIMARYFLPAVRGVVVHMLRRNGVGQPTIAKMVGVTQAAVSQILRRDERSYLNALEKMGVERNEALLLAGILCDALAENPAQSTGILYSFWRGLLSEGRLCAFHRSMHHQLSDCDICMSPSLDRFLDEERMAVLRTLDRCVKRLEASVTFEKLIPEVGSNIVYCLRKAETINDVAGVAGRIVVVDGRVRSVGRPSFGGSRHLASVLLRVRVYDPSVRSAINIKNNQDVRRILEEMGVELTEVEPRSKLLSEEEVLQDVESCFREKVVEAVLHGGGIGYEPVTYLFGKNPEELVEKVLKMSNRILKP